MQHPALARFHAYLRRGHLSRTVARDRVFLALYQLERARLKDIRQKLAENPLDRVTLYRSIRFLVASGIAQQFPNGVIELSDRFKQHHHHLLCERCGRETSFNHQGLEKALDRLAASYGFWTNSHTVELSGLCRQCADDQGKSGTGIYPGQIRRQLRD